MVGNYSYYLLSRRSDTENWVTHSRSGVARLECARVQRFKKAPLVPFTVFICSANKQSQHSGNFWVVLMFVIQAKVKLRFTVILDETYYTADLCYTLFKKKKILINRMVKI